MVLPVAMALLYLVGCIGAAILNPQLVRLALGFAIVAIALQLLPAWTLYHCGYKKHGTRYLTFTLCCAALAPLALMISISKWGKSNLSILLIVLLFWALWMYLCLRLRKINKKILAQFVLILNFFSL